MNRRNYARELEKIIQSNGENRPKLMLHACCGPCSTSVLEYLSKYFDITILWYNPNLYPEDEYNLRLETLKQVIDKMNLSDKVRLEIMPWNHEDYETLISDQLKNEPEGGKRCAACFSLRLKKTAETAKEQGYDYFCTTLTVSRHKDAVLINNLGENISKSVGIKWLPSDFKKRNGENRSQELSCMLNIYRQLYCGCEYSLEKRNKN